MDPTQPDFTSILRLMATNAPTTCHYHLSDACRNKSTALTKAISICPCCIAQILEELVKFVEIFLAKGSRNIDYVLMAKSISKSMSRNYSNICILRLSKECCDKSSSSNIICQQCIFQLVIEMEKSIEKELVSQHRKWKSNL